MHSEPAKKQSRRGGYAMLVAAGILLSRLAGLIRTRVMAHYLGNSRAADAFNAALKVPNFLQNLFGEGVLSASFIPVYARLLAGGDEKLAGRVAGVIATLLALVTSVLVLLGVLLTPVLIDLIAPGFEGEVRMLTIRIVRILFPGIGLLVLSAWCLGVLNSHRQFFLSYVAPVLWNAAMIATLVIFGTRLGQGELAVALAWGTVVGCALQFGVQVPFVLRSAKHLSFGLDTKLEPVREATKNFLPVVMGRGVVQLSAYIDQMIASYLPTGAVASIAYAQTIYLLPISLFGMSVAAAELPQMSGHVGEESEVYAAVRARLERGLRQIAFFVVPTVVAFLGIGRLLVAALYQTGDFAADDSLYVWYILIGSTIGLLVATLGRLYSSAFYALRDTRTPVKFAFARVAITAVLGILFAFPLRFVFARILEFVGLPIIQGGEASLGAVGITAASGMAAWVEYTLLRRALQRRVGPIEFSSRAQLRLWISAIAACAAAIAFDVFLGRRIAVHLPLTHLAEAGLAVIAFGGVYGVMTLALGVPEARATLSRFRR